MLSIGKGQGDKGHKLYIPVSLILLSTWYYSFSFFNPITGIVFS